MYVWYNYSVFLWNDSKRDIYSAERVNNLHTGNCYTKCPPRDISLKFSRNSKASASNFFEHLVKKIYHRYHMDSNIYSRLIFLATLQCFIRIAWVTVLYLCFSLHIYSYIELHRVLVWHFTSVFISPKTHNVYRITEID